MPNKWVTFVKYWSSKNNMSYGCAISKPECKAEYHKSKANESTERASMGGQDINIKPLAKPIVKTNRTSLRLQKQLETRSVIEKYKASSMGLPKK